MKGSFFKYAVLAISVFGISSAFATEKTVESATQNNIKVEDIQQEKPAQESEVTNAKVRAMAGSDSRYSLQGEFQYLGANIEKPFGNDRPNPLNDIVVPQTELSGTFGLAYRFNEASNVGVGTGITFVAPTSKGVSESEVSTPYVKYKRIYRALGADQVTTARLRYYTGRARDDARRDMAYSILHYMAYQLGTSRWTVGVDVGATYWTHLSNAPEGDYDSGWGGTPFVEYKLTDRFALTNSITFGGTHYQGMRSWSFKDDPVYGDLGVNMSFTDDIVVTPQVEYFPDDLRADNTTVGVAAIFNLL